MPGTERSYCDDATQAMLQKRQGNMPEYNLVRSIRPPAMILKEILQYKALRLPVRELFPEFFQKTATVTLGSRSSEDRPRRPVQSRDSTLSPLATPPPRLPCHPIAPNVSDEMRRQHLKTCRVCARLSAQDAATASIAHRHSESDGSLAPNPSKKKYVCYVCARGFERPSSLATHMNSHTGERPHLCSFPGCTKSFTTRSNMQRHFRTHGSSRMSEEDTHDYHYP